MAIPNHTNLSKRKLFTLLDCVFDNWEDQLDQSNFVDPSSPDSSLDSFSETNWKENIGSSSSSGFLDKVSKKIDRFVYPADLLEPPQVLIDEIAAIYEEEKKNCSDLRSLPISFEAKYPSGVAEGRVWFFEHDFNKIVVSDVDGTITKSDIAGLLTTNFGVYSYIHDGICSLYSNIAEKGYQLLYFTCRPVRGSEKTRKFLSSAKQDTKMLPPGPVFSVTSNYSSATIVPMLKLESRFKEGSLESIRAIFENNPFHSAFGNTSRDHSAYKSLQIPKFFIINGKVVTDENGKTYNNGYPSIQERVNELWK